MILNLNVGDINLMSDDFPLNGNTSNVNFTTLNLNSELCDIKHKAS